MSGTEQHHSDSEVDDPNKITDAVACLSYLKKREVFLYKMMNDPGHKAMLYFLEVLMNSNTQSITVDQLAERFSHKSISSDMREACGGGSSDGLREFLQKYPSLFSINDDGEVTSVSIDLPDIDNLISESALSDAAGSRASSIQGSKWDRHADNVIRPGSAPKTRQRMASMGDEKDNDLVGGGGGMNVYRSNQKDTCASTLSLLSERSLTSINSADSDYPPPNDASRNGVDCRHTRSSRLHKTGCDCCALAHTCHSLDDPGASTCLTCPLLDLNCSSHHARPHCTYTAAMNSILDDVHTTRTNPTSLCHCSVGASLRCCNSHHCGSTLHQAPSHLHRHHHSHTSQHHQSCIQASNWPTIEPMEKLLLETEAVKFFQQRLLKRDEKWIPIKSLAGHLSQANYNIRAVVGPQLEFQAFLQRHPQVFEVQGELVSVIDPLANILNQRRFKDRLGYAKPLHASRSSSNLTAAVQNQSSLSQTQAMGGAGNYNARFNNNNHERTPRPKSLILNPTNNATPWLLPSLFNGVPNNTNFANSSSASYNRKSFSQAKRSSALAYGPLVPNNGLGSTNSIPQPALLNSLGDPPPSATISQSGSHLRRTMSERSRADLPDYSTANSLALSMPSSEYQAIMFLRKALDKNGGKPGQPGMSLTALMQTVTSEASECIQSAIGLTQVEFEEFLVKHPIFFEVNSSVANNKRLQRMINIVICGEKPSEGGSARTLVNRSGRIFHVAKLWGIVDLGKHEHVFFDKSIFKHVDDLQKHFKIDDVLYFNAILAPKESRAKWRATQVWKECDKDNFPGPAQQQATVNNNVNSSINKHFRDVNEGHGMDNASSSGATNRLVKFKNCSDIDTTDATDDLPTDECNSTDEPCTDALNGGNGYEKQTKTASLGCAFDDQPSLIEGDEGMVTSYLSNDFNNSEGDNVGSCAEPPPAHNRNQLSKGQGDSKHDELSSSDSSASSLGISIAVQTLSTGDIMATQFYHDRSKVRID